MSAGSALCALKSRGIDSESSETLDLEAFFLRCALHHAFPGCNDCEAGQVEEETVLDDPSACAEKRGKIGRLSNVAKGAVEDPVPVVSKIR